MNTFSELALELIEFEKATQLNDNEVALGSQLSVERVHDLKSSASSNPTDEEVALLRRFMQAYPG
ncbi:LBP_cg2779 family protein [Limosilactobacillus equigenerosi]|uniref:Uncharacterized protein n=1 Tax=Limosilactobacillus equigenerosi DSM 18793 = JCM 14505 TaxID=1423742 RepID=A0A0R1UVU9_9LACO|nr:LBP_cg2779 family protein [Limosilactobacillus equigenerosi]KRL95106.1 hypothetical protein FC21_GL001154 [Limosilactobacillus equigenerosi DSM 18793 = JCM 14505]MCQ2569432.1 LBP_cg2779 family protein [Limosilactobacillus sp.]